MASLTNSVKLQPLNQQGFTLVETIISIALLLVFSISATSLSSLATKSVTLSQQRDAANRLAREGMEAVYAVRASDFTSVTQGTFHPVFGPSGWTLVSGSETTGSFTRSITISSIMRDIGCTTSVCDIVSAGGSTDEGSYKVVVLITWTEDGQSKQISQESLITYWR